MSTSATGNRFYFISFIVMAVLCLGGFVPSFFLRSQFYEQPLPGWLNAHGAVLTAWYAIAITQAWLILKGRQKFHRQLGCAAAVVALSAFFITYLTVAYLQGIGGHITGGARFNIILTSAFTLCVACGVFYRRKPHVHKRLMVMATALLTVPGFDRLMRVLLKPFIPDVTGAEAIQFVLVCAVIFIGIMFYRDFRELRRPALGTVLSFACFIVGGALGALFVETDMWSVMASALTPAEIGLDILLEYH